MIVEIKRRWETAKSVISEVWVGGELECYGLEPARVNPVHPGHPCIPAGSYEVILTPSPHLGYVTPEVLDVPGRTAIRWHIGNSPKDVIGCVAVGQGHNTDWVSQSEKAFESLMVTLKSAADQGDKITAIYTDPQEDSNG